MRSWPCSGWCPVAPRGNWPSAMPGSSLNSWSVGGWFVLQCRVVGRGGGRGQEGGGGGSRVHLHHQHKPQCFRKHTSLNIPTCLGKWLTKPDISWLRNAAFPGSSPIRLWGGCGVGWWWAVYHPGETVKGVLRLYPTAFLHWYSLVKF